MKDKMDCGQDASKMNAPKKGGVLEGKLTVTTVSLIYTLYCK